jgi:hypothetical protein
MVWLNKFFAGKFVVVFEGPYYEAKSAVTKARRSKLLKAYNEREFRKSVTIPDCLCADGNRQPPEGWSQNARSAGGGRFPARLHAGYELL